MHSRIYQGVVTHHRHAPHDHFFQYNLFMLYLDLNELPSLFDRFWLWSAKRPALAWFKRNDHVGDASVPLDIAVRRLVQKETGHYPNGPIRLLTHLRYFGYGMNPVSFYYCWNRANTKVEFVIAEINNTPWGEQHCYVLDCRQQISDKYHFSFNKDFHVSPFMPMEQRYSWQIAKPDTQLSVSMKNMEAGECVFNAYMRLHAQEITSKNLAQSLVQFPFMTGKVIAAIYWQALKLWFKRTPFYSHPKHLNHEELSNERFKSGL